MRQHLTNDLKIPLFLICFCRSIDKMAGIFFTLIFVCFQKIHTKQMANTKLIFFGTSSTSKHELEVNVNHENNLFICIDMDGSNKRENYAFITLDRDTAIKLQKEIRKQISFMEV